MAHSPDKSNLSTSSLLGRLFKTAGLKEFLDIFDGMFIDPSFHEHLQRLCAEKNLIPEHVIKSSGIDRTYGHQLFSGIRQPSRDKVVQLAFGFPLTVEETQELLKVAGKSPLYPKIKRDAVLLYCLKKRMSFIDAQAALQELSLPLVGREGRYE
jgi:hypothetical protein